MAVMYVFVLTAAESESQPEVKTEEDLPVDSKLYNLRNVILEPDDNKTLKEVCKYTKNYDLLCFNG